MSFVCFQLNYVLYSLALDCCLPLKRKILIYINNKQYRHSQLQLLLINLRRSRFSCYMIIVIGLRWCWRCRCSFRSFRRWRRWRWCVYLTNIHVWTLERCACDGRENKTQLVQLYFKTVGRPSMRKTKRFSW